MSVSGLPAAKAPAVGYATAATAAVRTAAVAMRDFTDTGTCLSVTDSGAGPAGCPADHSLYVTDVQAAHTSTVRPFSSPPKV
ncbi:hypothetical protein GCM10010218_54750 [Streptomyces mashuensis]|uniref:Uncharacterized protein n=1 Tax=Streptomyces mashuensis TaxID=33904 RepID=A0A919B7G4_9ACTN|nr:hypothetical protein GCM10010218_54750 [Streptomyces mashuensis]